MWRNPVLKVGLRLVAQVSRDGVDVDLIARGRHDPCVVPRAVPMVEAMVAIVLADQLLRVRHTIYSCIVCTSLNFTRPIRHRRALIALHRQLCRVHMSGSSPVVLPASATLRQSHLSWCGDTALPFASKQDSHVHCAKPAPSSTADSGTAGGAQHVAQCEVLPRGEGPSPDARVNTQLRVPVQPAQTLEHLTAAV